jgi:hypothetical protein
MEKAQKRIQIIDDFENNTFGAIVGSEDEIVTLNMSKQR